LIQEIVEKTECVRQGLLGRGGIADDFDDLGVELGGKGVFLPSPQIELDILDSVRYLSARGIGVLLLPFNSPSSIPNIGGNSRDKDKN